MKSNNEQSGSGGASSLREQIINTIGQHRQFEKLYRDNKLNFKREFNLAYPALQGFASAQVWYERLNYENEHVAAGNRGELIVVILASLAAALIAKIPEITGLNPDHFFPRNISFVVFPLLMLYFAWRQQVPVKTIIPAAILILFSVCYINYLPNHNDSDTLILSCVHLPIFLWALLGYIFAGGPGHPQGRRIDYLRFNGDLVVMSTLMLIAGGLLTGITLGLFELIQIRIEDVYFKYVVISGLSAVPIVGSYLVLNNPQLVSKVSPVIAKVFSPLVFITLLVYLGAVIYTGKDPYNDRDFLLIFNGLLIGVMALILFSVAEISKNGSGKTNVLLLFALSVITVIINLIALSAILFRISEWGITPNRLAVLGANVLMLGNLLLVGCRLFRAINRKEEIEQVEKSIAIFLPVYAGWTIVVTFLFPLLFGFK